MTSTLKSTRYLATLRRHQCSRGRLSRASANPVELLPVVRVATAPSVGATAGLEPKVLAGRDVVRVVLVLILPPAVVGVHVGLGLALPVDVDLKADESVAAFISAVPRPMEGFGWHRRSSQKQCGRRGNGSALATVTTGTTRRGWVGEGGSRRTLRWAQLRLLISHMFIRKNPVAMPPQNHPGLTFPGRGHEVPPSRPGRHRQSALH